MIGVGSVLGGYEVTRELTKGGMATLYLGRRSGPAGFARLVAIKVIRADLASDPHFREMFLDEARLSARIHHPNVVHVEELGEHDGELYLVMEYIDGVTVAELLRGFALQRRWVPIHLAVHIVTKVADGLHGAHESTHEDGQPLNLVHRDVSPQNVLISSRGHVKIIDFGVAKARGRLTQTEAGALKGKLAYMAPEQVRGQPIDRRSDVFSLGIVLWEMLTLRRLYYRAREADILFAIRNATIDPPSRHRSELHPDLDHVVLTALGNEPDARFQTAHALRRALLTVSPHAGLVDASEMAQLVREVAASDLDRRRSALALALEDASDTDVTVVAPPAVSSFDDPSTEDFLAPALTGSANISDHERRAQEARGASDALTGVRTLGGLCEALLAAGDLERASATVGEAAQRASGQGPGALGIVASLEARVASARGEHGAHRAALVRARALFDQAGWVRLAAQARVDLAEAHLRFGSLDAAGAEIEAALEASRADGMQDIEASAQLALGRLLASRRDLAGAERALGKALLSAEQRGEPTVELYARLARADLLCHGERWVEARGEADEALRLAAHREVRSAQARAHGALARASLGAGQSEPALLHSERALAFAGAPGEDGDAELWLIRAEVLRRVGRADEAAAIRTQARQRLEQGAARIGDPGLREAFLRGAAEHRALLDAD